MNNNTISNMTNNTVNNTAKGVESSAVREAINKKDPMIGMPLELVMKLEVRCDALMEYSKLTDEQKNRVKELAAKSPTREETERIINRIARGEFNG